MCPAISTAPGSAALAIGLPVDAPVGSTMAPSSTIHAAAAAASTAAPASKIPNANQLSSVPDKEGGGGYENVSCEVYSDKCVSCDNNLPNRSPVSSPPPLTSDQSTVNFLNKLASQISVPLKPSACLSDNLLNLKPFISRPLCQKRPPSSKKNPEL